jgi:long-chain acyl-CoA synthetase
MLGYYKNKEATADAFTGEWFHTGDMGRIDGAGLLYITGRKKNVIILSNGKNIYPEEIEGYYLRIPYVREIIVFAPTSGGKQNRLCAEVFLDEAFREEAGDAAAMERLHQDMAEINKKLPGYKQVHSAALRDTMFEKTTKKSIKRHVINR